MKYKASDFTTEEKFRLLVGKDCWKTEDFEGRLYSVNMSDGPIGVRTPDRSVKDGYRDAPSVAYPSGEVLAQTWNLSLARKMGECLADDCIEKGVDVLLGPGVNIKRNPLCGRNFEYFSEDPFVAGMFAREYITGIQRKHVGVSLKHYCANNLEYGRFWLSSEVDERTLREIYLTPFEIACEASPYTVMCSYNAVNGVFMSENKKLYDVLRKEFGFDGLIVSDWGAVKSRAAALRAGLDLEMPYSANGAEELRAAYEKGEITDEQLDECVNRVLRLIERCEEDSKKRVISMTKEQRLLNAQRVAEEGIVLLKNNGVLPIRDGTSVSICEDWDHHYYAGGGSSRVVPSGAVGTICDAMTKAFPKSEVVCASSDVAWRQRYAAAFENAALHEVAIVVCGNEPWEGGDLEGNMRLSERDERRILDTAQINCNSVVVLRCGAAIDISAWGDRVAAIVWAGFGGERGNEALAAVLSGKVNPSGRLTETFANHRNDYPCMEQYSDSRVTVYGEGLNVGYRYFDRAQEKVRFPFGFGLSYSSFAYSDLKTEKTKEGVVVTFRIRNTSSLDGADVAQIYVRQPNAPVYRPQKELKGFEKVYLKAGEEKEVSILLDRRAFSYYSVALDRYTVTPQTFEIFVARNAQEICLSTTVEMTA